MQRDDGRLDTAVEQGIITPAQAVAIRALPHHGGIAAAHIAYAIGAIIVVVAMGWFLGDRWEWLGSGGVLAVVAVYATLFLFAARVLRREGYPTPAGLAVLLAVLLTPIAVVALNDLLGWFPEMGLRTRACRFPGALFWDCRGLEVVAELATAAAALIALRRVRFSLLVVPLIVIFLRGLLHLADAMSPVNVNDAIAGWLWVIGASVLATVAYLADRRQVGDADFAFWLHIGAGIAAFIASMLLVEVYDFYRHLLVPGAFVAFAAALTMRRTSWVIVGMAWFTWYLGWLAGEVFRDTPVFPIVLAALGIAVIVATVWVQRNAERLTRRFGVVSDDGRPRFPGGVPLLLAPMLVAALMLPDGVRADRQRQVEMDFRTRVHRRQAARANAAARAAADSNAAASVARPAPRRGEDPTGRKP